ncbi:MAG: molecular chaperone HscC [Mitsuaria chitosanitabida]|uniref:Hsp70 family protein n=1 Tax=Roseateles chitosanitabidus TaxID=65048 RepID=UPI001B2D102B|nr:molecular chaperone HscC [Roseateles chitosanitabidus]MBO9686639.1 molecular chaperone HscC [Roseateles chitosanitabidus]
MIVGIDLGTTNSLIAVFRDGRPQLIPNALGDFSTPSAVALDETGKLIVGLAARERATTDPGRSAQAFKRWMGSDRTVTLGDRKFRAEELSALVLQSLKADAEAFLGEPVTEAVITVPAYFNEAQRRATRTAGELAGLKVERLLNEPTAAGLAYGLQDRPDNSTFLVFDLGGGTFDVSVLEYFDGVVEVRASAGDTRLGGEDFAHAAGKLFLERCTGLSPAERERLLQDPTLWWRAAEQAKRDLSERDQTVMGLMLDGRRLELELTRADFETATAELLQRLRRPIERALQDAQLSPTALDEVVLVGGATRMPMIRQLITRLFQRLPLRTIDPDQAIAQGAAVQAGLKARDAALEEVVLTDVMPFSLGVISSQQIGQQRVGDRFSPIIERNTPVPVSRMNRYVTVSDNQSHVELDIRQGESPVGSDNLHLGKLEIELPPLPAGQAEVEVRFTYDANGLLEVDVRDVQRGRTASTLIRNTATEMSEAQIEQALARLRMLKRHPRDEEENRYLIERAKRLYEDRLGAEREAIQHWLSQFEQVLDTQDGRAIRQARVQMREALDSVDGGFRF